jgi:predicted ATPase
MYSRWAMAVTRIHVTGYRSVRNLRFQLGPINVLTGPNGCGKSNLYTSLVLLSRAAQGQLARAIASEGGTASILWAGVQKRITSKSTRRVSLEVEFGEYGYNLTFGLVS